MDNLINSHSQCPVEYTLSLIGGKWKPYILHHLAFSQVMRYGELKRSMPSITHKMLSAQLKELEADGLIIRTEFPQIPPKVEYALSEKGISLIPVFEAMSAWGQSYMPVIEKNAV